MRARFVLLAVLSFSSEAMADSTVRFLICQPGGPDVSEHDQKVLGRMYRYLERKTGLPKGAIEGVYTNSLERCEQELKKKPHVLFPSVPIFVKHQTALGLEPLAQISMEGKTTDHFYVLVRPDGPARLEALKDKEITGTNLGSPDFVGCMVLEGRAGPSRDLKLKPQKRSLRAIRFVANGKAAAVVLNGDAYRTMKSTKYGKDLKVLHTSGPLPTAPVALTKQAVPPRFAEKLTRALTSMTVDPEGKEVIKSYRIEGFLAASAADWAGLKAKLKSCP